ncbi:hypothetical protein POTOM_038031 [Populus tomentosa]|uniref:Origin recognition complex subunit 4 C-terminal domain-containing protein n=1 Tax=Populus tomentosa TaxID=118781 RepID=A0A8X7YUW7_POPTO|nr:hypothetical protein POTOM_038031 [Populus tomentosa]
MVSLAVRACGLAHKTNIFALGEFDCSFEETFTRDRIRATSNIDHRLFLLVLVADCYLGYNTYPLLKLPFDARCVAISHMELKSGFLSLENFKAALSRIQRQPKKECIKDCSILELSILVFMKRLEVKEQNSYNFNSVMKGQLSHLRTMEFTSDEFFQGNCSSFAGYKRFIAGSAADNLMQTKQEEPGENWKCYRRPMQLRNDAFAYSSISSVLKHFEKEIRVPLQWKARMIDE